MLLFVYAAVQWINAYKFDVQAFKMEGYLGELYIGKVLYLVVIQASCMYFKADQSNSYVKRKKKQLVVTS